VLAAVEQGANQKDPDGGEADGHGAGGDLRPAVHGQCVEYGALGEIEDLEPSGERFDDEELEPDLRVRGPRESEPKRPVAVVHVWLGFWDMVRYGTSRRAATFVNYTAFGKRIHEGSKGFSSYLIEGF
jgi:hypothetical protein